MPGVRALPQQPCRLRCVSLLGALLLATPALAYDTARAPSGEPLRWASMPRSIYLDASLAPFAAPPLQRIGPADLVSALTAAAQVWSDLPCGAVSLRYAGATPTMPQHDIYVRFETHDFALGLGDDTARVDLDVDASGDIVRAVISLNAVVYGGEAAFFQWKWKQPMEDPYDQDVQIVLVHALGHALGLVHTREHDAAMFFQPRTGYALHDDDTRGGCFLYPAAGTTFELGRPCDACDSHATCGDGGSGCLTWPDGRTYCGRACTTHGDCPARFSCNTVEGAGKQCLPDTRRCDEGGYDTAVGGACWGDANCGPPAQCWADLIGGYCSTYCDTSHGDYDCPLGTSCAPTSGGDGRCVAVGSGGLGASCEQSDACASVLCAPSIDPLGGFCATLCAKNSDCTSKRPDAVCTAPFCVVPGGHPLGWPCESHFDCASAYCLETPAGGVRVCSRECVAATECSGGTGCVPAAGSGSAAGPNAKSRCEPYGLPIEGFPCSTPGGCAQGNHCDPRQYGELGLCRAICNAFHPPEGLDPCGAGWWCSWLEDGSGFGGGICRPDTGGVPPDASCDATKACRADRVCAAVPGDGGRCRRPCSATTGLGCDSGETCIPAKRSNGQPSKAGVCLPKGASGALYATFIDPAPPKGPEHAGKSFVIEGLRVMTEADLARPVAPGGSQSCGSRPAGAGGAIPAIGVVLGVLCAWVARRVARGGNP